MANKFECTELNKEINVNWSCIVFVANTGHIPTVADSEMSAIKTKMLDCISNDGLSVAMLGKIAKSELNRLVAEYQLNEVDTKHFSKLILDEVAEMINFFE